MSEEIKITVVLHVEKTIAQDDAASDKKINLTQTSSLTLMPVLLKNGLMDGSFCGGRGDCGRCVVQFLDGAPLPTGLERGRLKPEELRQGYRLACVTRPKADCTVRIVKSEEEDTPIVTDWKLLSENIDCNSQENNLSENQKPSAMKSHAKAETEYKNAIKKSSVISKNEANVMEYAGESPGEDKKESSRYIIAVDLGTTTIAMQLRDAETGSVADTYCGINPQRRYGTDVLARVQASVDGHGEELRELVCEAILRGYKQFVEYLQRMKGSAAGQILCMCIAGNTVMEHLLLGYDVEGLGKSPFTPKETGLQIFSPREIFFGLSEAFCTSGCGCWEENADFPIYIAPCISAFVGGDIVAGLYALKLLDAGETRQSSGRQAVLLIDLGTNGEMVLIDGQRMIATATAAGPAFEGDGSIIGTDRIALTAELLRRGILDETGLLAEPYFTEGLRVRADGSIGRETDAASTKDGTGAATADMNVYRQEDIRALQMAKAAVRVGVRILWEKMGRPEIGQVFLAGGFGYYLDVEAAVSIGLLPVSMRGRVRAVGNTSLAGAYELGRDLLDRRTDAACLEAKTALVQSMNLAKTGQFSQIYLEYMNLGEN